MTVATEEQPMQYSGFWRRSAAAIIDAIALTLIFSPVFFVSFFLSGYIIFEIITLVISSAYYIYLHSRYGATFGKQAVGIKVVSLDGSEITSKQSLYRFSPYIIYAGVGLATIITLMPLFANQENPMSAMEIQEMILEDPPIFTTLSNIFFALFFIAEIISVLVTKTKRSLHDFIAGTVVIRDFSSDGHYN